jgi:outer membrane receptor for ferrienterochelin and colicins
MDYGALQKLFGEPVTTSATGTPQRETETPADMIIVTADDIRRSGAQDIPGVLRHVTGIDVLQWTNSDADVSVRGYNQAYSSRLLVLIDGRQVYADYYGHTAWSTLPVELSAIRQIEIVKGPNSALFGFNAVGGVINIITYNPLYDNISTASAAVGTQNLKEASAVTTFRLGDDAAFRLSAGRRADSDYSTSIPASIAGAPRGDNDRTAADLDGVYRLSDKIELNFEVSHSEVQQNEMDPAYALVYSRYITDSVKGQVLADTSLGLLKLATYTTWTTQNSDIPPAIGHIDLGNVVTILQAEDVLAVDNDNNIRVAAEYRHDSVDTAPIHGGTITYNILSASGMWDWKISPELTLTNAARLDRISLGRSGVLPAGYPLTNADWNNSSLEFSYNSGLVWKASSLDTVRIIASKGVETPSLVNAGGILVVSPYLHVTGVPTLESSDVWNYEVSWDRTLPTLDAEFQADVYHQDSFDLIAESGAIIATPTTFYSTPANAGSSHADGVELSAKGEFLDDWRWGAGYRLELINDTTPPNERDAASYLEYWQTTPRSLVNANLGWSNNKWETDGYLRYQSGMSGLQAGGLRPNLVPVPGYFSFDGRIAYRVTDWATVALSAQNLLSARQQQTSGPDIERSVLGTFSVRF